MNNVMKTLAAIAGALLYYALLGAIFDLSYGVVSAWVGGLILSALAIAKLRADFVAWDRGGPAGHLDRAQIESDFSP